MMAWLMFENREVYLETITPLLKEVDLVTLDKVCKLLIKQVYPSAYID